MSVGASASVARRQCLDCRAALSLDEALGFEGEFYCEAHKPSGAIRASEVPRPPVDRSGIEEIERASNRLDRVLQFLIDLLYPW